MQRNYGWDWSEDCGGEEVVDDVGNGGWGDFEGGGWGGRRRRGMREGGGSPVGVLGFGEERVVVGREVVRTVKEFKEVIGKGRDVGRDVGREGGGGVRLKGRKRALLVGINYKRTPGARCLEGCVNDCRWMWEMLKRNFGFCDEDIWVLTDEPVDIVGNVKRFTPTKRNILNGMKWIVNGATPGSHCFWSFSGHGGRVRDTNGDEEDGWDETILPVDFPSAGEIVDDDIHEIMVKGLCRGARLTAVMDCCHSGTGMDLPYVHSPYGAAGDFRVAAAVWKVLDKVRGKKKKRKSSEKSKVIVGAMGSWGTRTLTKQQQIAQRKMLESRGQVILFSACEDHQKSADAFLTLPGGNATGAMTYAFIEAIKHGHRNWDQYTYKSLLVAMREKLANMGHAQIPQLSTSHPWDLDMTFSL